MMKKLPYSLQNIKRLESAFSSVDIIDFALDSYIDSNMGQVWVDDITNPNSFLLLIGIFMIFSGTPNANMAKDALKAVDKYAIVLPSNKGWFDLIKTCDQYKTENIERFIMAGDDLDLAFLKRITTPIEYDIRKITLADANEISKHKDFSYHLQNFKNPYDFIDKGQGVIAINEDTIVGIASSALVCKKGIEVNIMVPPKHRTKGIALALGAKLLMNVLEEKKVANWDAGNLASKHLSMKLGYKFIKSYAALRLTKC